MKKYFTFSLLIVASTHLIILASGNEKLNKTASAHYTKFNINNISTFIYNNGIGDQQPNDNSSFEFPKGSVKHIVYASGFVWGGKVNGQIRVGGSTFQSGLNPGKILQDGTAENPSSENVRVFRVRRDYKIADLSMEAKDEKKSVNDVYNQYEKDWIEWPVQRGAPHEDVDGNGKYEPAIDIPGVPGADQTLWYVANDLNEATSLSFFGSPSMGIEMQTTVWGYNATGFIGNVMFKKNVLINKSKNTFTDMIVGLWADPDIGDAANDFAGCDSLLNLGFCYNAFIRDALFDPLPPPAFGCLLIQGPLVDGEKDQFGYRYGKKIFGKKNLPMTSFGYVYKNEIEIGRDAVRGDYNNGTLVIYNYLQGKTFYGQPFPVPSALGGGTTKFPMSGDPIQKTGFVDGIQRVAADRRLMVNSGQFNMAPGDTQEVVYAEMAAGAEKGVNNLAAVLLLKHMAKYIPESYYWVPPIGLSITSPVVEKVELDKRIVLNWGSKISSVSEIEKSRSEIYDFEGYNVYQIPSKESNPEDGIKIATYDKVNGINSIRDYVYNFESGNFDYALVQNGTDSGIKRFISIEKDYLTNSPLINGKEYYFAVTSYIIDKRLTVSPNNYESTKNIISSIPQAPKPGMVLPKNYGEIIFSNKIAGSSNAEVNAFVVNPFAVKNNEYEFRFFKKDELLNWKLIDLKNGNEVLSDQKNISGDDDYFIVDGLMFRVKDGSQKLNPDDVYRITTTAPSIDVDRAKDDVEQIVVYPNPYYYASSEGQLLNEVKVKFMHLPKRAIIRIFNIATQLIKKIEKDSDDQFAEWNLFTDWGLPAPSGIYIINIEMPELGKSKILKLAIAQ